MVLGSLRAGFLSARRVKELGLWWLVFLTCLIPVSLITFDAFNNNLGADPAKVIVDFLGLWALHFLWISLAITPIRHLFGWRRPLAFRRMLGLYAFFYASLHLLSVATFIFGWRLDLLIREVSERPYVIVGTLAFLLLVPLAITSTKGWQRKLKSNWMRLHKLVYPASILVLIHIVWLIRASYFDAFLYGGLLAFLLGYRLYRHGKNQRRRRVNSQAKIAE